MCAKANHSAGNSVDPSDAGRRMAEIASETPLSVFVLDDDPLVAKTLATMANLSGAQTRIAHSAAEFFQEWAREPADVAIVDLQMPDRDGLDVMRQLGALGSAQVILSSGCDPRILEAARHVARDSGLSVIGVLPKPTRRSVLKALLEKVIPTKDIIIEIKTEKATIVINEDKLQAALSQSQIRPYFQPLIRLSDRSVYGFEALARWDHPDLGAIGPDQFIPVAEAHGLLWQITETMIDNALAFLAQIGDRATVMAVNVPTDLCAQSSFPEFLTSMLARHVLTPDRLIIEVTETGPLGLTQDHIDALTRLRMHGFNLSIDDFGTGVSSLERLVRIPFNELKIDRYFVQEITTSPEAENLVQNLVQIARSMGMAVVIEGVEDAAAMDLAQDLGCSYAQGYHIAKPMPATQALDWLANWPRGGAAGPGRAG